VSAPGGLVSRYDAVVCDLDGVVYRGPSAVEHAVEVIGSLAVPVLYATNNASRSPADVATHLRELGLDCTPEAVATSSQAGAWLLTDRHQPGSPVLAVGGAGVATALEEAGLTAVLPAEAAAGAEVRAVLQGYGPAVTATDLAEAAYAVEAGATWAATNTDGTLPTDRGVAPGNGSLVAAVERAVGHPPDLVAGKPAPPLYLMCAQRLALPPTRVLAVGDRLDTDIEGAVAAGMDSLLVLTGVDDLAAPLEAPARRRPTWVAPDLRSLLADPAEADATLALLTAAMHAVHRARDSGATNDEVDALVARAHGVVAAAAHR
jgi:HAD superfamily hydrolase (TIGR01450 family)